MTIRKIGLSVIAVAMLGTATFAGTVSNSTDVGLIGKEKITVSDVNITGVFGDATNPTTGTIVYTPTNIPATSLKNPIFVFTFANAKDLLADSDGNVSVFECQDGNESNTSADNWRLVANNPQVSGDNNNVISFNAINGDIYAYNGKKYVVADANTSGDDGNLSSAASVQATVIKGSTSDVTLQAELYSGDSQSQADLATAQPIANIAPEYVATITQKFDARIDASNSFKTFYDRDAGNGKTDDAIFTLERKSTLNGATLGVSKMKLDLTFDQNLSANNYQDDSASAFFTKDAYNDFNATYTSEDLASGAKVDTAAITLTVDGDSEIKKTVFDAHIYVTDGTNTFDVIPKTTGNAGAWTIYGYNAQIPNVTYIPDTINTTLKFTNRSSLDTNIYFTLIDQDGTVVTLNSVDNPELAKLPAGSTATYKASDLLDLIDNADFNKDASFSVEVSIPTTPNNVYGFASFKNYKLNQFKDLPIYNTSGMTY